MARPTTRVEHLHQQVLHQLEAGDRPTELLALLGIGELPGAPDGIAPGVVQ
jgi:hypothetical protein